ncbi:MAG: 4-hydroxy-tetrahydrodipicolinate synthase [Vulcanimicrobiaceae bacterium]
MNLGSVLTAMVTPFDAHGALDVPLAARLASWLVERGNDGLVIAGSTGEGMSLDAAERRSLFAAVVQAVGGRAATIANVGSNDTRATIAAAAQAQAAGVDALLVVVPYYNKPTQGGMLAHFGAVAQATSLPILVYNIPGRTAVNMLPQTLLELARRHSNIVGVKESSGDLKQIATILRDRSDGFRVFAGDDHLFLPCLALGADGVVGVASHLCSREFVQMRNAYNGGYVAQAARIHARLLALFDALFATTSPAPIKWAMEQMGFAVGAPRLPLEALPPELAQRLAPLIEPYTSEVAQSR